MYVCIHVRLYGVRMGGRDEELAVSFFIPIGVGDF